MTDITIYTSANNGEEILVLPIVPKNLPEIVQEWGHESLVTNEEELTLIGKRRKKTMSLELLLPVNKDYCSINSKAEKDGYKYIEFWDKWSNKLVPMRLVITEGTKELVNIAYTINKFSHYYDKKKDIHAVLDISEYIFTKDSGNADEEEEKEYKWENIKISYGAGTITVRASNIEGHWLVPVRKVLELAGYDVEWNAEEKSIYIKKEDSIKLTTEFEIYEGTSYSYIYKLCEELGYSAEWNGEAREVKLK